MQSRKKRKKAVKNLDKYVIGAAIYIAVWSIAFFIAWLFLRLEPSVLEGCILAPGVVELVACAWIKQGKKGTKANEAEIDQ